MDVEPYLGDIGIWPGTYAPDGWLFCEGQTLSVQQYTALFTLIGNKYGGDGKTTFMLPNFKGLSPIGVGNAPNLTPRTLGEKGGATTVTLIDPVNTPSHQHQVAVCAVKGTTNNPSNNLLAVGPTGQKMYSDPQSGPNAGVLSTTALAPSPGKGQPHNNMPPYLVLRFVIAVEGSYPPFS